VPDGIVDTKAWAPLATHQKPDRQSTSAPGIRGKRIVASSSKTADTEDKMTLSTTSHRAQVPTTTTERHREEQSTRQPPHPALPTIEPTDDADNTLQARYGFWIQTLKNHPIGIHKGIYLSTFQRGRGQHITALDTGQARKLGERLIALADDIEAESA